MIKKLRRNFILISALSVLFVLAITIGVINTANYVSVENSASGVLTEIMREGPQESLEPGGDPSKGREGGRVELRQEHYFVTSFNPDGSIKQTDNRQMFILSLEQCNELARKVYNNELTGGKYGDFRFRKQSNNGLTYVGFVDIKERLDNFHSFLLLSSLISVGAYLLFIILILIGSKVVFKSSEEAYKKQKRFITNASHELKTPITVINADLDLVEMDSGKSEWTESIRDQLNRLTEMTNQLVTLSRLEEDDPGKYPFEDFSLNEVCKPIADSFASSFKKEDITFAYNITGNLTMHGNRRLIDELIHIFLDNSLKYTGGDNKSSYFTVSENSRGKIEFRFSNTLDKNDEVDVRQVMERFYRSPSNKKEGSGIGLSIASEIIKLHKGKINAEKNNSAISFLITF